MLITEQQLLQILPNAGQKAGVFVPALNAPMGKQLAEQAEAYERDREQATVAVIDWQESQQIEHRALEDRLQANDQTHYQELRDAQTYQARLRNQLATADVRLSVLLAVAPGGGGGTPIAAGAGSVDHGGARAELDPAAAQRIVAID